MSSTNEHSPFALCASTDDGFSPNLSFVQFLWMWNFSQGRTTPELHERIAVWMEEKWRGEIRRMLLTIFRDAGKSTIVGLFCCWILRRTPDLRILVLAAEHALACKMTRAIRRIIERHPAAAGLVPDRQESWTSDHLTVKRPLVQRDPSVLARGIGANITGTRADVVICDDVEVPNTSASTHKRSDLRDRLLEASFVLVPGGGHIYVGTPHSYYSIYAKSAHPEIGEEQPFLQGFERLEIPIVDEHGRSSWPDRFSMEEIDRLRAQVGPAKFRSQMMLEPMRSDTIRLDPDRMGRYQQPLSVLRSSGKPTIRIGERTIANCVAAWDPAYARPETGDGSAIAAVFVDTEGDYWLHAVEYLNPHDPSLADEQDEATRSCRMAIAFARRHHARSLVVETNGIGRFLPALLRREARDLAGAMPMIERHSSVGKDRRILAALDPLLAARRLHVHEQVWETPFIEEMREWRPGGRCRDDGLDAVATCILEMPARLSDGMAASGATRRDGPIFEAHTIFDV